MNYMEHTALYWVEVAHDRRTIDEALTMGYRWDFLVAPLERGLRFSIDYLTKDLKLNPNHPSVQRHVEELRTLEEDGFHAFYKMVE